MTTTPEPFAALVEFALRVRRERTAGRVRQALTGAVAPELIDRTLAHPAVDRQVAILPAHQREAAVSALAIIVRHKHLSHSPVGTLGDALARLHGSTAADALAVAAGSSRRVAVSLLGNALDQAGDTGPVNLVEFTALIAQWDDLTLRERSRFLVDFHTADRA